ncbi:MAG: LysR family transcriptional regulator [Magnetovibrionaceae bacterium]
MRHTTLRQMQVFNAVAKHLSFSKAARELHLTQPAVSLQVKQLESRTQVPLFEQVGRKLHLTGAGEELLGHIKTVLSAIEDAEEAMQALRGRQAGGLKIGVISTAKYFAPTILSAFVAGYPGVDLTLKVANREQIIALLADNAVDLCFMGRPPTDMKIQAHRFASHPLVMIASANHPLAGKACQFADLTEETFLLRESGSGTRTVMEALLAENHIQPRKSMEMASNETIKQAVMAGMGVSLLSRHTVGLEVSAGRLAILDIANTPVLRDWYLVHREGKRLLPVAEAFVSFIRENGARLIDESTRTTPARRSRHRKLAQQPRA